MTPEQKARQEIDRQLTQCGWVVQSFRDMNISAGLGVAVREFRLKSGFADYLLYNEAQIDANMKRAARLRQSILKVAFEGKLVPQDPTDEPSNDLLERLHAEQAQGKVAVDLHCMPTTQYHILREGTQHERNTIN
jgi:hypothetical protein